MRVIVCGRGKLGQAGVQSEEIEQSNSHYASINALQNTDIGTIQVKQPGPTGEALVTAVGACPDTCTHQARCTPP